MTITSSAFKKGQAKPAGSGRKKGTLNKTDQAVKDIITETFDRLGGIPALLQWAQENPEAFYTRVWGKLIPTNLQAEINVNDFTPLLEKARARVLELEAKRLN